MATMQLDTTAYVAPAPQKAFVLCADCGEPIKLLPHCVDD